MKITSVIGIVVVAAIVIAVVAYFTSHQTLVPTGPTTSPVTTLPSVSPQGLEVRNAFTSNLSGVTSKNVAVVYSLMTSYPVLNGGRNYSLVTENYTRYGNNVKIVAVQGGYVTGSVPVYVRIFSQFYVNGTYYICKLEHLVNDSNLSAPAPCTTVAKPYISVLNLSQIMNLTYLASTNPETVLPLFTMNMSNYTVQPVANYTGFDTMHYHANLVSQLNPSIAGTMDLYVSTQYNMPISYTVRITDPLYNASNNTISTRMYTITPLNSNINESDVVPAYLASYIANNTR